MTAPFTLAIKAPPVRHSEGTKYVANVLWIAGFSAATIGNWIGLRKPQVLALVQKDPLIDRSTATDAQRRELLSDLKSIRFDDGAALDGGLLDKFDWRILPLTGRKRRPGRAT